jgi:hypothetical protein
MYMITGEAMRMEPSSPLAATACFERGVNDE